MAGSSSAIFTLTFGCTMALTAGIAAARAVDLPVACSATIGLAAWSAYLGLKSTIGPAGAPRRTGMAVALALAWACAGACLSASRHAHFAASPLLQAVRAGPQGAAEIFVVRGWIADDSIRRDGRLRFLVKVERVRKQGSWKRCPGTVRVTVRDPEEKLRVAYGDRLELPLRLKEPRNFGNPGAFDYRTSLEADGIHLLGSLKSWRLAQRLPQPGGLRLLHLVHRLRLRLMQRLATAFPEGSSAGSIRFLAEILVGARDGGDEDLDRVMKRTGVYHIVSISGLHFALLMSLIAACARRLPGGKLLELPLLFLAGGFYLLLSGGEDPIFRCALAGVAQTCGRLMGRRVSGWNAQSMAALILLGLHPLHLFQPSFQLSFLATAGILVAENADWGRLRAIPWVGRSLAVSAGAWMASTPVMASTFLQVTPVALIMNLLAGPFLALSLIAGSLLLAFPLPRLGDLFTACVRLFHGACAAALEFPGSFRYVPPPPWVLLAALAALPLVHAYSTSARARRVLAGALGVALLLIVFPPPLWTSPERMSMTALDVGQGDSLLLILPGNHSILVDAGGFSASEFDVGEKVVLPALLTLGVRRLDLAVLTHAHQDHGGGLPAILEALPVDELWLGRCPKGSPLVQRITRLAHQKGIPCLHPTRGSVRCFGESCIEVMHPPARYRPGAPAGNDDSLVMRIRYRASSVLLTGDVEAEGEGLVLHAGKGIRSEVLKVAHHGSASSTSEDLLARVSPRLAVISVGEGNPWGHPSPRVLERLGRAGAETLRTDRLGAVQLCSDGKQWRRCLPSE